jgi:GntR family transcriptional regulator / MocR family aminotransferase
VWVDIFLTHTKRSIARDLFGQFRDGILSGRLAPGDRLPPSRELANHLGISRATVTTVYSRLVAEGFVEGRAGGGSYVTGAPTTTRWQSVSTPLRPRPTLPTRTPQPRLESLPTDLRAGIPDATLFPMKAWRQCLALSTLAAPPNYDNAAGEPELRRIIAHWIGRSRSVVARPDDIVITSGAQQAIDLTLRLLTVPGDRVAVEDPGYPPVRDLCIALSLIPVPIRVDSEGIVVAEIPDDVRVIYTTPSHQSPTGATMSLTRRKALLEFATTNYVAVIEDDYDSEYRHVDRPLEPLHLLDRSGRVIYIGTLSKTLTPAMRVGFAAFPTELAPGATTLRRLSDMQPQTFTQQAVARFIADGHFDRHLRRTRKIYRQRHQIVIEFLDQQHQLGHLAAIGTNYCGLHVTAYITNGQTENNIVDAAAAAGIALSNFSDCWMTRNQPEGLTIGFGNVETEQLCEALTSLQTILSSSEHPPRRSRSARP